MKLKLIPAIDHSCRGCVFYAGVGEISCILKGAEFIRVNCVECFQKVPDGACLPSFSIYVPDLEE